MLDTLFHTLPRRGAILKNERSLKGKKVNLIRFCDDFVITGENKELLEQKVKPLVVSFLKERGLTLSKEKTKITHIEEGFEFLGQHVKKYGGTKLLIKPTHRSYKQLLCKLKVIFKQHKTSTQEMLIRQLNPVIRGWCNYHRHVVSKITFKKLGKELSWFLWRWMVRRHPEKSVQWIISKYFQHTVDGKVFAVKVKKKGKWQTIPIGNPAKVKIKRHVAIRSDANPYDPSWKECSLPEKNGLNLPHSLNPLLIKILWHKKSMVEQLLPLLSERQSKKVKTQ